MIMACFIVPAAEAVISTIITKAVQKKVKIQYLLQKARRKDRKVEFLSREN